MEVNDSQTRSIPTIVVRPQNLPHDVVHPREVEWLGELKSRLAAVHAWRGTSTVPPVAARHDRPAPFA